jgi:nitroreductase
VDAETLLTTTRTVRRKLDLDAPVPPEALTDALRIAQQAPSAGSMVGALRWVIVRDAGLRAGIADRVRASAAQVFARYGDLPDTPTLRSARHLLDNLHRVPVLAIPCLPGRPPAGNAAQLSSFYGSAYPTVWSFQLALRLHGLASSMCAYHLLSHEAEVADLLGIPADTTQITLLAVARSTQPDFHPAARPPVTDITYVDHWGTPAVGAA